MGKQSLPTLLRDEWYRKFLCTYIYGDRMDLLQHENKIKCNATIGLVCTLSKFTYLLCFVASFECCMRSIRKFDFDSTKLHILHIYLQREHKNPVHFFHFYAFTCKISTYKIFMFKLPFKLYMQTRILYKKIPSKSSYKITPRQ